MNGIDVTRAITSVTVTRTNSLREQSRSAKKEDQAGNDNCVLGMNTRSLSNDKISSDSMVPVIIYQRGSSLRHFGKNTLPNSSLNSTSHHPFQIIKPIDTSPRASENCIDSDPVSNVKVSSQRLKFKHRGQIAIQGGPLIPDHNLIKEPPRETITYTPRPPLVKRFSSDQDETNSDIDTNQSNKTLRSYQIYTTTTAPKPPISPTRVIIQTSRSSNNTIVSNVEKPERPINNVDEDTSELEDAPNSDCETPPLSNNPADTTNDTKQRSSLRKGYESPNQFDVPGRSSPSPTKTVKWNLTTEVKKIPRSRSLNGKFKSSKSRSIKSDTDKNNKIAINDQKVVESHDTFISHCTALIRHQASLIDSLRHDKISVSSYKKDLAECLENQNRLVTNLRNILDNVAISQDNTSPVSKL